MIAKKLLAFVIAGSFLAAPMVGSAEEQGMKDTMITAKVKGQILTDSTGMKNTDGSSVSVETYNGKVQLCGFVNNKETAELALKSTKSITDVKDIVNNIIVK